ncbi:MAG: hypothetical protein WCS55_04685 [Sulfuricurvum sp.]|uniref:hypothetical protein n=1 Tax=Sulfuricurvum sp. TaxID=2025608 RepID=UPI003565F272
MEITEPTLRVTHSDQSGNFMTTISGKKIVYDMIGRYLMSNAEGRWDGSEKAQRHIELCEFYLNCFGIDKIDEYEAFEAVHEATQELTDNLDTMIGFPLKGRPDYDDLEPKFFEIFHKIAVQTLFDYLKDEPEGEDDE